MEEVWIDEYGDQEEYYLVCVGVQDDLLVVVI